MASHTTIIANTSEYPIYVAIDETEGSAKRKVEEMIKKASNEPENGYNASKPSEFELTGSFGFTEVFPGYSAKFVRGETKTAFVSIYHYYSLPPRVFRGVRLPCAGYRVQNDATIVFDKFNQVVTHEGLLEEFQKSPLDENLRQEAFKRFAEAEKQRANIPRVKSDE
ncbi:unnamed protein product [Caenorhabditis auriculariae]|uniref:Uncharacterized protein n=1 Tax=Caenorhabditis auriculariae TaxID=2777116 RepID=A0A8S1GTW9_9PELO|nr:unnamed protein product [Caenorhabditis auriculariae]